MKELKDYQIDALRKMKNGCILCGGTGSGKSLTSLAYYFLENGGKLNPFQKMPHPKDLYIITTAKKRDTKEWDSELSNYLMTTNDKLKVYNHKVVVDSWNNITKYVNVFNAFFIFDEQRLVGSGAWVKAFYKIAKANSWILLSATPGDTWSDYIPVFVANGFFKNKSEFTRNHCIYSRFSKYPKIDRYIDVERLIRLRNNILIEMKYKRPTVTHHEDVYVDYDIFDYKRLMKERFNVEKDEPIQNASELCYELRKIVNKDESRIEKVWELANECQRAIIFYNFDYELDILKDLFVDSVFEVGEWNGHKHQPVPVNDKWVYLVQYNAGAEGWNCITTNSIIFYSQNYSYKMMVQSAGRIDRMNTPFPDLYYYHLKSRSSIDLAIAKALKDKKKFNETKFVNY